MILCWAVRIVRVILFWKVQVNDHNNDICVSLWTIDIGNCTLDMEIQLSMMLGYHCNYLIITI